jgi:hypothetical protein
LWPGQNPLGKQVRMSARAGGTSRALEVVGIVQEIKHFGPEAKVRWMQVYVPQYQDPSPTLSFVLNAAMPEAAVKPAIDKVIHELDKDLPIENFQTMDTYLDKYLSPRRVSLLLLSAFAGTGILWGCLAFTAWSQQQCFAGGGKSQSAWRWEQPSLAQSHLLPGLAFLPLRAAF